VSGDDLAAMATLQDPVRRVLYDYVVAQRREVGRGEAAQAAGIQRTLAAFHLDKLVEAGLLEADSRRLTGRTGPGSGRPAKVYRRAAGERQVTLPPRDYRTLALILADIVETLGAEEQAESTARRIGERLASARPTAASRATDRANLSTPDLSTPDLSTPDLGSADLGSADLGSADLDGADSADLDSADLKTADLDGADLEAVLEERGYEPYADGDRLRLRNCPFRVAAERHPLLVCSMNLALCEGLLAGLGGDPGRAVLDPRPGECCVAFSSPATSKTNES
jgi:predicted ArsR family transcriptional regulator